MALTIDEEGQARTADWKVRVAERLITDLTQNWGLRTSDIIIDALTFPIATGQEETRRDGIETIEAIRTIKERFPEVQTTLGLSNISFGLNPAARVVLNSVFLNECIEAGLDSAIVHAAKIIPMARIPDEQRETALDMVYDRRRPATDDEPAYDPLQHFLEIFEGVTTADTKAERAAELLKLPVGERLQRRIVDGEGKGLADDLELALADGKPALEIINTDLLEGMKVVGELFGSGQMQLPFVLQSAEVMKTAVAYLEPYLEKTDSAGKGTIVLATVKGDVHDIGKNLVDIILTNNGYTVVNLGIKQPITTILEAADEHRADAIGMSGLLVKSTVVMRENLEEMNTRGVPSYPVFLGGAALTRAYVEQDLREVYAGEVRYARDAFEGLRLMDALMAVKRGEEGAALPAPRERRVKAKTPRRSPTEEGPGTTRPARPTWPSTSTCPTPPFWGRGSSRASRWPTSRRTWTSGPPSWASGGSRAPAGADVRGAGRDRGPAAAARLAGPDPDRGHRASSPSCTATGPATARATTWSCSTRVPRSARRSCTGSPSRGSGGAGTCVWPTSSATASWRRRRARTWWPSTSCTMGAAVSKATAVLFENNAYRDYLELHGLSVQLTEGLAEMWHDRVRSDLGFADDNGSVDEMIRDQAYRGSRYSFGYPACPDLEDRAKLVDLLKPERIGVELSEELQLHPEQSTDALIVHHPEAKYFNAR